MNTSPTKLRQSERDVLDMIRADPGISTPELLGALPHISEHTIRCALTVLRQWRRVWAQRNTDLARLDGYHANTRYWWPAD